MALDNPRSTLSVKLVAPDSPKTLDPLGPDSELRWLPAIGPTSWLLARRLVADARAGYFIHDRHALAHSLGVYPEALEKALKRLVRFKLAAYDDQTGELIVQDPWRTR